jgi:hypothetical protein
MEQIQELSHQILRMQIYCKGNPQYSGIPAPFSIMMIPNNLWHRKFFMQDNTACRSNCFWSGGGLFTGLLSAPLTLKACKI